MSRQQTEHKTAAELESSARTQRFVLGIVSLGAGIPITAIAASVPDSSFGSLVGVGIAWLGIVGVNVSHSLGQRRSRP